METMGSMIWGLLFPFAIAFVFYEAGRAVEQQKQIEKEVEQLKKSQLERDRPDLSDKTEED